MSKNTDKLVITPQRKKFYSKYEDFDDSETIKELLFAQQLQLDKLDDIRSNTSKLVWWLVALPVILGLIFALGGLAL